MESSSHLDAVLDAILILRAGIYDVGKPFDEVIILAHGQERKNQNCEQLLVRRSMHCTAIQPWQ